jgi:small subunit ribosomal protein S20
MANIKSARKRARQAVGRRSRNVSLQTAARTAIKDVKKAIAAGDKKAAAAALVKSQATIDRVASCTATPPRGRRAASRTPSRRCPEKARALPPFQSVSPARRTLASSVRSATRPSRVLSSLSLANASRNR